MSRRRKAEDADIFAALVRVMMRVGPTELTLAVIAREAGITAGALVQRFGSKRELMLAHAVHAAATGDIGLDKPPRKARSPLQALRESIAPYAILGTSPEAALRNLAYLQRDLGDTALHPNLLRMSRAARQHYAEQIADAVKAEELCQEIHVPTLARLIEVTLIGSFINWTVYRQGSIKKWLRRDLDAVLRPHLANGATAEQDSCKGRG